MSSLKHRLKLGLRDCVALTVYHTGLDRLISRLAPTRLTILAGHCVADEDVNGALPADMKIEAGKLERILLALGRRHRMCTVAEGLAALDEGASRSMVALTMDDGYRDNLTRLAPLLEKVGARATVYVESRPLSDDRVNWSHKYFWLIERLDVEQVARQYMERAAHKASLEKLRRVLQEGDNLTYSVKRVFKYEAPAAERDAILDELFAQSGGDESALRSRIYLSRDEAAQLQACGVEIGGHTHNHPVLATLDGQAARREVEEGRSSLTAMLGDAAGKSFAYPFGRRWDFNADSVAALQASGYASAVTTHAGTNEARCDRFRLARMMIDDGTQVHLLVAEACGVFALLKRCGLDLSE